MCTIKIQLNIQRFLTLFTDFLPFVYLVLSTPLPDLSNFLGRSSLSFSLFRWMSKVTTLNTFPFLLGSSPGFFSFRLDETLILPSVVMILLWLWHQNTSFSRLWCRWRSPWPPSGCTDSPPAVVVPPSAGRSLRDPCGDVTRNGQSGARMCARSRYLGWEGRERSSVSRSADNWEEAVSECRLRRSSIG